jgi:DNA recombination protein RmuC
LDTTALLLGLALGLVAGFVLAFLLLQWRQGTTANTGAQLLQQAERSFNNLAQQTLLQSMDQLAQVRETVAARFQELASHLEHTATQTRSLAETADRLRQALENRQVRGAWGERIAADVLQAAGLVSGVHYVQQQGTSTGTRPDFTFLLPNQRRLHMDVKFPLDNYLLALKAVEPGERDRLEGQFLQDVRARVREIATRDYIDPAEQTVDCALLFIPLEAVYSFILQRDPDLFDYSLKRKVILCSPFTLFAVVAVIRQAAEYFMLQKASHEILSLLSAFTKEWGKYLDALGKLGEHLTRAQKEYDDLISTRRRALERPLAKLEQLRQREGIAAVAEVPVADEEKS